MNMLLVAVGPLRVAFAAHEKTEACFWGFLKAFLFIGLLYMPLLGLACQFAGVIMAQMTTMVADSGLVYGDGTDISVHFLFVVLGPFCAFAVVRAAPMFVGMVLGTGGGGGGGGAAFALAAAGSRAAGGTASSGHGGRGADDAIIRAEADRIMSGSGGEQAASSRLGDDQVDVANLRGE